MKAGLFRRLGVLLQSPHLRISTIELEQLPAQGELRLRDAMGRVVLKQHVSDHYTTLALHGAGSGVYMVEVWDASGRIATQRLVLE